MGKTEVTQESLECGSVTSSLGKKPFSIITLFTGRRIPPVPTEKPDSAEERAGILSKLTWQWLSPLLKTGYLRNIEREDLYKVRERNSAAVIQQRLESNLEKQYAKYHAKLLKKGLSEQEAHLKLQDSAKPLVLALNQTFFWKFWLAGLFALVKDLCGIASAMVSRVLIEYIQDRYLYRGTDREPKVGRGVGPSIGLFLLAVGVTFFFNHMFYNVKMVGAQARAALVAVIYSKSTRLSAKGRAQYTTGKITNLAAIDAHRVDLSCESFHYITIFLPVVGCAIAVLVVNLKVAALVGIATMIVLIFVVAGITIFSMKLRAIIVKLTDKRVTYIREALQSIRIIKYYGWEVPYCDKIKKVRLDETRNYAKMGSIRGTAIGMFQALPILAGALSFITYAALGHGTDPARMFSSLTLFNLLLPALAVLPQALQAAGDARVALRRIQRFLGAEESTPTTVFDATLESTDDAVIVEDASFIWPEVVDDKSDKEKAKDAKKEEKDKKKAEKKAKKAAKEIAVVVEEEVEHEKTEGSSESEKGTLKSTFKGFNNLSFKIKRGEFVVVTGPIGSGKSSLLAAITGSMVLTGGSVRVSSTEWIGCLEPWIQNATVRDNIVFGRKFDSEWYRTVVTACQLSQDLKIMTHGDNTMIGERGITVSGGQKARINLARAIYGNPEILIMDDVLSAVDARVGAGIVDDCLRGLAKNSTRILATHQLSVLPKADHVIFMDAEGQFHIGTYQELEADNEQFKALLAAGSMSKEEVVAVDETEVVIEGDLEDDCDNKEEYEDAAETISILADATQELQKVTTTVSAFEENDNMMEEEERMRDAVGLHVYWQYFRQANPSRVKVMMFIGMIFISMIVIAFLFVFTSVWLSFWTGDRFHASRNFYTGIYIMLGILLLLAVAGYMIVNEINSAMAARNLHNHALDSVFAARTSFFDTTPQGRIINRFTRDTDSLDNELAMRLTMLFFGVSAFFSNFLLTCVYVPYVTLVLVPVGFVFYVSLGYYRKSAREVKRIDSIERSHMMSVFNESISGMPVIIMYKAQHRLMNKLQATLDDMDSAYFLTAANQRWLSLRLDGLGSLVVLVATILVAVGVFDLTPSNMGLIISAASFIPEVMSMVAQAVAELENCMNATERILYYKDNIPAEAAREVDGTELDQRPNWPEQGAISFNNVSMKYRDGLPYVLKSLSVDFQGGHKVGICGRTGAGKSTILQTLYRIVELAEGSITIDGVDISTIGLHQLRSQLSIIPQEPVLFLGTIRSNLDPLEQYSDAELWGSLRRSGLLDEGETEGKFHLDQKVEADGSNFSLGERQLLTLARALLRNTKILVLDEATSNVDYKTDKLVQETISREFGHCTILCIAHRLRTIAKYDRILVLESGEINQYDTPWNLYNDKEGIFRGMCDTSGLNEVDFNK
ncbi:P-loop containing nucleoside triphosphate hydrolase protein [Yarrowia lipolytica]|uniref:P-loop containing nucleoside triphosphate hydrolase protein n=1 Tax=Yarrowia lipolytica TaxID=4952 RepID=A0A371C5L4_YARLL|nr:P-loop containing nucleoside triphosphate hydrolase protein [Yarrowia lipolytica]RDW30258.1 P-loop containing nucleoside triphosphate hydrolase protein [Yarrowia lipolytica]RDW39355.1 P-loop containing nucleoside triphosphate hydrolase protein [Yarrowia lipolytica]RDW43388.1 P-loop containing nucleoside triphosphate hydrolase protein [Yarrowia lipolytica]RDW50166.1 P-loop containing nucleoside triphosphate hydrolase protein [Yarrowia lipolytica]